MSTYQLENDHNVYVIGAGFSAGAGLPVVRDCFSRMGDWIARLSRQRREQELASIKEVLEFRLRGASAAYRTSLDLENVEELFSLVSAMGPFSLTAHMQRAIAATIDYCTCTSASIDARTQTLLLRPT